jgi:hypothetical protein
MNEPKNIGGFLESFESSFSDGSFIKLTLGKKASKSSTLNNVYFRPVLIKNEKLLSVVFRHQTSDITKNLSLTEGIIFLKENVGTAFLTASLFTSKEDIQILFNKKREARIFTSKPSLTALQEFEHDKIKHRLIKTEGSIYLQKLGLISSDGKIIASMNDKFRQIDKYIEIIDSNLKENKPDKLFTIIDMGSGKGYLTFALYDHLANNLKIPVRITGVEMRQNLVDLCNKIARESGFEGLSFVQGNIGDYNIEQIDMLIALHACDTATDDAIFKGITADAGYIICAPCCHKQIRKEMNPENEMKPILKHGIFMERQAEMLTDGLRALILEKHGYQTKAFEFISTNHTPKNVMIVGRKSQVKPDVEKIAGQIHQIKKAFGIEKHYLEELLDKNEVASRQ